MSSFSIGGLVTGLDTQTMISSLMEVERAPQKIMLRTQQRFQSQSSVYTQLKSALSSLQTTMQGMSSASTLKGMKSAVGDGTVLTASATSTATPGVHTLEVLSLARSQRQVSTGYADGALFNAGSYTIDDGAGTVTPVTVSEGSNTLQGVAAAINGSGANVTASVVNDGSATPNRLVITGKDTKSYTMDFSNLLTLLGPEDPSYQAASQASFKLDGITITKASNAVSDALEGVTFNLLKEGATTTLNISNDSDGVTNKINDFIAGYNSAIKLIGAQSGYDAAKKTAGILSGDTTLRSIQSQLRSLLTTSVPGASPYSSLAQLGITSSKTDGSLSLDTTRLSAALSSNFDNVVDLFTHNTDTFVSHPQSEYGIAQQFNLVLKALVHPYEGASSTHNGLIATRIEGLKGSISDIDKQIESMEARIAKMQEAMKKKFAAMESMISSLQNQGSSLLAALGANSTSSSK